MICAGIDAGSRATKIVLLDSESRHVLVRLTADQGVNQKQIAEALFQRACEEAGVQSAEVQNIVATGYGRNLVEFAGTTITEITCHARGVYHQAPTTRTIIEIGGQDSKVIALENSGRVRDFAMNDRCAAGSGRFLEILAGRLGVPLHELDTRCGGCGVAASISSMCVVFAETEIIGLLSQGVTPDKIAAGVQNSIASRVMAMAGRLLQPPVCFTGGVALLPGMITALETALNCAVLPAAMPQYTGALGAAILAAEQNPGRATA